MIKSYDDGRQAIYNDQNGATYAQRYHGMSVVIDNKGNQHYIVDGTSQYGQGNNRNTTQRGIH